MPSPYEPEGPQGLGTKKLSGPLPTVKPIRLIDEIWAQELRRTTTTHVDRAPALASGAALGHQDLQDLEPQPTSRCIDGGDLATPATEQRAAERRGSRDASCERVCLEGADKLVLNLLSVLEVA